MSVLVFMQISPCNTWTVSKSEILDQVTEHTKSVKLSVLLSKYFCDALSWAFNIHLAYFLFQSGTMLYSGTRRGTIFGHDLRSKSTYHTMKLSHTAAVCSLKALCNENHLLASDFAEKVHKVTDRFLHLLQQG